MTCAAVIVDDRLEIALKAIKEHAEFIPKDWAIINYAEIQISNANDYNQLLTSLEFWTRFSSYDRVLIFQHDSGLLRHGIEEFLEYDFIGAPLYHIPMPAMNGGLSIRSVDKMIEVIEKHPYNPAIHGNEDLYFCNHMGIYGGRLPTKEVSQSFSVETIWGLGSLGFHAIEKWHTPEKCEEILNQYK